MRHQYGDRDRALVIALSLALIAFAPAVARAQNESGEPGEGESYYRPIPCPASFSGYASNYKGYSWKGSWSRTAIVNFNVARYIGTSNPFVNTTQKWEWLNPEGKFSCNEHVVIPGVLVVEDYYMMEGSGAVVPYGTEDVETVQEETNTPGGDDYHGDGEEWYLCWYYLYRDGSRSPYFYCERIA